MAIDREDNDPVRFWTYVVHALRMHHPEAGSASLPMLTAPRIDVIADLLPTLFTELASLDRQLVLVLDDYHLVTNTSIDQALAYFVEHLPTCLSLVIASRTEPPLPLARLRARGLLVEIGAELLSFSESETQALLNDLNDLQLTTSTISRLRDRTEGWAAGLYLAALTMRSQPDREAFVAAFAGNDRHVVDYLSAEVIAGLSAEDRHFLRFTAPLDRLCADLCDAVMSSDSANRTLRELEASNTFLVPLDSRREWYRYHHLFGELLRHELPLDPPQKRGVHSRASAWYRDHGFASDAIRHATAAGDVAEASRLILDHWTEARNRARLESLISWIEALPPSAVRSDPRLGLILATTLQETGRLDDADEWLTTVQSAMPAAPAGIESASLASGVAACRSINEYFRGDADGILAVAEPALAQLHDDHDEGASADYWQSALLTTTGAALYIIGHEDEAAEALRRAAAVGRASGHHLALIHALGWSALVATRQQQMREARAAVDDINALLETHPGLGSYYGAALAHIARAAVATTQDTGTDPLHTPEWECRRGIELARRGQARFEEIVGLTLLAQILARNDQLEAAGESLNRAQRCIDMCRNPGRLPLLVEEAASGLSDQQSTELSYGQSLSDREMAVLRLLATNLSQREIGQHMYLSFNTVKTHVKNIFRKLETTSREEAVRRARQLGLL